MISLSCPKWTNPIIRIQRTPNAAFSFIILLSILRSQNDRKETMKYQPRNGSIFEISQVYRISQTAWSSVSLLFRDFRFTRFDYTLENGWNGWSCDLQQLTSTERKDSRRIFKTVTQKRLAVSRCTVEWLYLVITGTDRGKHRSNEAKLAVAVRFPAYIRILLVDLPCV